MAGSITPYQRSKLASEAVGTPGVDQSSAILGQAVGKAAGEIAGVLSARQEALDKIQYTNAYYDFQKQDELKRVELQNTYRSDPTKLNTAYLESSTEIQNSVREKLPESQRVKFDSLVSQRRAATQPDNLRWTFDRQNQLGLDRTAEFGDSLSLNAQTWVGADGFLKGMNDYRTEFKNTYAPILSDPEKAEARYAKNATLMYLASMRDNNTGNAIQLRKDFEENQEFKQEIIKTLGTKEYARQEALARKQVSALMSEQTFDMVKEFTISDPAIGRINKLFSTPEGIAVSQAQRDVLTSENALDVLLKEPNDPNSPDYAEKVKHIGLMQEQLKQDKMILEIASNRNNANVKTDVGVYAALQAKQIAAAVGLTTDSQRTASAEALAKAESRGVSDGPQGVVQNLMTVANPFDLNYAKKAIALYGMVGVDFNKRPGAQANQTYSEYLQNMFKLKGEILHERNQGNISDKDAHTLIAKLQGPMSTLESYDRIQGGDSEYVQAYKEFDDYAQNAAVRVPKGTPASQAKAMRDTIRTRMVSDFAERWADMQEQAAGMGQTFGVNNAKVLIREIKANYNGKLAGAQYQGLKPKEDYITINGRPMRFTGYNPQTGVPQVDDPSLDNNMRNV